MTKPKILLAENSTIVLQIEKRYLQDAGASLFTAANTEDALRIARKILPNLVLVSSSLPADGGATLCRTMKLDPRLSDVPVVMVCTAAEEEVRSSREAGCDAVVTKPIDRKQFLYTTLSLVTKTSPDGDRMVCRAVVACTLGAETFYGTIEDISVSGMFVGSNREPAPGDQVSVKFILPRSGADLITCDARVNWVNSRKRQSKDHLPPGFGITFQGMEQKASDQIADYMKLVRMQLGM